MPAVADDTIDGDQGQHEKRDDVATRHSGGGVVGEPDDECYGDSKHTGEDIFGRADRLDRSTGLQQLLYGVSTDGSVGCRRDNDLTTDVAIGSIPAATCQVNDSARVTRPMVQEHQGEDIWR